jgi:hypothetical protein
MHPNIREVAAHMREFGLHILGRAIYDVTFSEMTRPFAHALAVVHAAHGAEITIKARIAEEHPLLIFTKLPPSTSTSAYLTVSELLSARSVDYPELPELLWATTGTRLGHAAEFKQFGLLRNQIVHFSVPERNLPQETMRFCIEIMEPLLHEFWGESAIPRAEEWDETIVAGGYLQEQLATQGIVIPECVQVRLDVGTSDS